MRLFVRQVCSSAFMRLCLQQVCSSAFMRLRVPNSMGSKNPGAFPLWAISAFSETTASLISSFALLALAGTSALSAQLPPPPARYFNDYAHVVSPDVAENLNRRLADF